VRGKSLTYTITLKGLKERDLLPLDDELAQTVNESTLEKLREDILTDLHQTRTNEKRTEVVNQIIEQMANGAAIELPPPMIDDAISEDLNNLRMRLAQQRQSLEEYLRLSGQTEEELREEMRPATATRLRNSLLLREIAKREGIEVSDDEIEREVESIVALTGGDREEQVREMYRPEGYFRGALRNDLFDRRLTDRLIEIATDGRGAVLNGWTPQDQPSEITEEAEAEEKSAATEKSAAEATNRGEEGGDETLVATAESGEAGAAE
jgi:trigger factor